MELNFDHLRPPDQGFWSTRFRDLRGAGWAQIVAIAFLATVALLVMWGAIWASSQNSGPGAPSNPCNGASASNPPSQECRNLIEREVG